MSYKKSMIPASFRGVPFFVDRSSAKFGRRVKLIQYYRKDNPWLSDYGPEADVYVVEGHIIQNYTNDYNYFSNRDDLIAACKGKGSGTLKHPYYGEVRVGVLEPVQFDEDVEEGGIVRFSIVFAQWSKSKYKGTTVEFIAQVDTATDVAKVAAKDSFFDKFIAAGAFLADLAGDLSAMVANVKGIVNKVKGTIASVMNAVASAIASIASLIGGLLNSPCDLAAAIFSATDSILAAAGMLGDNLQGGIIGGCSGNRREGSTTAGSTEILDGESVPSELGRSMISNMLSSVTFEEDNFEIIATEQANNRTLIIDMFKANTLFNIAKILIRISFYSSDEMEKILAIVMEAFEEFLQRLGDNGTDNDMLYTAVDNVRSVLAESVRGKNEELKKEIEIDVGNNVISDLELAYNRYDDINRADEIYNRNPEIRHPGFLPAGDTVKVLNE